MPALAIARMEFLIARRNMWVVVSVAVMALFVSVLTLAGGGSSAGLGVDPLVVATGSLTTLMVYLVPLIALLLSFDAIAGEAERGTLALALTYPIARGNILLGKFLAHLAVMAAAVGAGMLICLALTVWQHGPPGGSLMPLLVLFVSALALAAAFLGMGYAVSARLGSTSMAAGAVILLWLVFVVLYDLGLLAALLADGGGAFTTEIFPWLLVANPADAFRLINLPEASVPVLATGLDAAGRVAGTGGQIASLLVWPLAAFLMAWGVFRRAEP